MFGIGMPEMILILAIALIVIGPKKLPDLAKSLGKAMGEFKNAASDLKDSIAIDDGDLKDVKNAFEDVNRDIKDTVNLSAGKVEKNTDSSSSVADDGEDKTPDDKDKDTIDNTRAAFDRMKNQDSEKKEPSDEPDDAPESEKRTDA